MMALNRYRLKHLKKSGHRGATLASKLLDRPDRLIGLILIGNNLVNIVASAIATVVAIRLLGNAGIAVATILLTLVILIFAEVTPKTIAAFHPEKIAFTTSFLLWPLLRIFYPVVWFVNIITNSLLKVIGFDPETREPEQLSSEELRTIVGDSGVRIHRRHRGMVLNILDLEKATVNDIMIPRNEVYGIDLDLPEEALNSSISNCDFTRVPVYRDNIDNVIGFYHTRNTGKLVGDSGIDGRKIHRFLREPYFVPEGTPLNTQLFNFQKQKRRIGLVVDEYGDIQGIVTLEDILEEIVGEFTSNLDDVIDEIYPQPDGSFIVNGTTTIREVNRSLNLNLSTNGPKTLNGLIIERLELFPDGNASIIIDDCRIEILDLKENLIQTTRLEKIASPANNYND